MGVRASFTKEQRARVIDAVLAHFPGVDPKQVRQEWSIEATSGGGFIEIRLMQHLTIAEVNTVFAATAMYPENQEQPHGHD
jgi:hypothetical protein